MNGAFAPLKPEPVSHCKPSPEVKAKLAKLRDEALARAVAMSQRVPGVWQAPCKFERAAG